MSQGFRSLHPFVCFLYYVAAITLIMLYQHPFYMFFSGVLLVLFNIALDKGKMLRSWSVILVVFPVLFLLITPLFNHRGNHLLFYLFNNPITLEAIMQGLMNGLSIFAIITIFISFNMVITADKFLFLFSKWLPQWALLIMLSLRFIPLFRRRMNEIMMVQKTRGTSITDGPFRQRIKDGLLLVQILLTWSLEDGIQTADSMAARGYGLQKRSKYIPYQLKKPDFIIILILLLTLAIGVFGWWLGDGVLSLTPMLEPALLYGREWLFFIVYIFIIGFPLIIEGKEVLVWHYWKQNN